MIRSNSKIFREKIQKYVIENISAEASTPIEALKNTLENFRAFYCPNEKKENPQIINALMHFFNTGATDLSIWYDEHRALLKEWFEQTEVEAEKSDNVQVSNTFYYQVAKAFISLCKDYNINVEKEWDTQVSPVLSTTFSVSPDKRKTVSKETEKKIVDAYLKGESYTSIEKAYNVYYRTIKKVCRGLSRPEIPLSQIKVIELVLKNYTRKEIADELKLNYYYVCDLITLSIKQNRLSKSIVNRHKIPERTKLIIDDLQNGMPQIRVAEKHNLSRQRINQIIKEQLIK